MQDLNNTINQILGTIGSRPDSKAILISLATALLLSLILWFAYRLSNTLATYQPRFAATLVALAFLSTILMDLIQSNLALSLGMLGSLSIVRFRTNIKDPRDIGFIFWSMAIGLSASIGCYLIGVIGSIVLAAFMISTRKHSTLPDGMMLVIRGSRTNIHNIYGVVESTCTRSAVKAKNILADSFELVYEVQISIPDSDGMINRLFELDGVDSVNLLVSQKTA